MLAFFALLGQGIASFFGFKQAQGQAVTTALKTLSDINVSEGTREQAIATIISAEASSGYWLAACWRPLLMLFFASLIGARWFGYMPHNMSEAELMELYGLVKLGIGGYIGGRSLEKIVSGLNIGAILKTYISKGLK